MSDRRTEIAQLVGIDPRALRDLKASLVDALVRKGVLVTLHIGRWRARRKLDPEDLGLDPRTSDAIFRSIELGHSSCSRARRSISCPGWSPRAAPILPATPSIPGSGRSCPRTASQSFGRSMSN